VLPPGSPPLEPADVPVLLDTDGEAHRLYGTQGGGAYLVRPDGYIGHRTRRAEVDRLLRYLGRVFDGRRATSAGVVTAGLRERAP
jgi:hypothetical protein